MKMTIIIEPQNKAEQDEIPALIDLIKADPVLPNLGMKKIVIKKKIKKAKG